jgi:molybdopterin synthase catalytic subunit
MIPLRQGSGGRAPLRQGSVRLVERPFDPATELGGFCAGRTMSGAVASFIGIARGEAGAATALELEAYPGFTEQEIGRFVEEARQRFGLHDALVTHRWGSIAPGEAIVLVATAAAHRREAFEACDYLMDYLKSRAPFWKKEHGPAGARWVEPTQRDLADIARWD